MKIKASSWHYRYIFSSLISERDYVNNHNKLSLCQYICLFLRATSNYVFAFAMMVFFIAPIGFFLWSIPSMFLVGWNILYDTIALVGFVFILTLATIIVGITWVEFKVARKIGKVLSSLSTRVDDTSAVKINEPNIFIEWIKAKKEKICPIIEVIQ